MRKEVTGQILAGTAPVPRIKIVPYQGANLHLYSVGWLSYLSKLAVVTIRLWERQKLLPKPFFKLADGNRWYTAAELSEYTKAIQGYYQEGRDKQKLRAELGAISARLRTDYKSLTPANLKAYNRHYFELPGEAKHETIIIRQQQQNRKLKHTKKQLLVTIHENTKRASENSHGQSPPVSQANSQLPNGGSAVWR